MGRGHFLSDLSFSFFLSPTLVPFPRRRCGGENSPLLEPVSSFVGSQSHLLTQLTA
eukprot:NODE_3465_length_368_cov_263.642633_g2797_i0.p2 GENE.NODE_3465_length_368_cov_263.642633_g2797_i0~~NODE_3465_length_368_cov_263.642633_g2797_i0.p2  ORF type:complete len:56 (+),score=13.10 NODE_3465_length_368_cov_263.642633_g2797_i0:29-196(+)